MPKKKVVPTKVAKKTVGPLPLWAYAVLIGGAILVFKYEQGQRSLQATAQDNVPAQVPANVGNPNEFVFGNYDPNIVSPAPGGGGGPAAPGPTPVAQGTTVQAATPIQTIIDSFGSLLNYKQSRRDDQVQANRDYGSPQQGTSGGVYTPSDRTGDHLTTVDTISNVTGRESMNGSSVTGWVGLGSIGDPGYAVKRRQAERV